MIIGGYMPNSFVDFPGNISGVVFLAGCNMKCWYCHNKGLLTGEYDEIPEDEIIAKITKRKDFLDGVVITGGEPLLYPINELIDFIQKLKNLGLKIKLDTNGTFPDKLEKLIPYVDYIAMDIKAPLDKYDMVTPVTADMIQSIRRSIKLIIGTPNHEFRTTFDPKLTHDDIIKIAEELKGAKKYFLQQINIPDGIDILQKPMEYIAECAKLACKYVPTAVRNM